MPCEDGVIRSRPADAQCAQRARPWVLAATILGSSMAFIDGSVVNVALPAIQTNLAASFVGMQWVINAYALLLATLILVGGAAGDRFGRRRIFMLGIGVFTAASVGCGLAANVPQLILARAAQGLGGALLVPTSLAIISATFDSSERGKAIGAWAGFSALTAAFGPVLGGWFADALSWRAIFFINVPLALTAIAIAVRYVPESRAQSAGGSLDWPGALLATLGLGALTYALIEAPELGWRHPAVLGAGAAAAPLVMAFVWQEARSAAPMVPLQLFRSSTFAGVNLMTLWLYFGLSGSLFFLPFNLIQVQGYSATQAGAAFLPFTVIMGGLSRWSGGLLGKYGARPPLIAGPLIATVGFALLAAPGIGGSYWKTFFPGILVLAFGMTISVAPLTTTVLNAVEDRYSGTASGINNAVSRTAALLAIAVFGAVALLVSKGALDERLAALELPPAVIQAIHQTEDKLAAAKVPHTMSLAQQHKVQDAIDEAFVVSFRIIMLIAAGTALASALCAGIMVKPKLSPEPNAACHGGG